MRSPGDPLATSFAALIYVVVMRDAEDEYEQLYEGGGMRGPLAWLASVLQALAAERLSLVSQPSTFCLPCHTYRTVEGQTAYALQL